MGLSPNLNSVIGFLVLPMMVNEVTLCNLVMSTFLREVLVPILIVFKFGKFSSPSRLLRLFVVMNSVAFVPASVRIYASPTDAIHPFSRAWSRIVELEIDTFGAFGSIWQIVNSAFFTLFSMRMEPTQTFFIYLWFGDFLFCYPFCSIYN